jgi:hypothetical protein
MTRKSDGARRTRTGSFWTIYIFAWMALAAGALSYLVLAATNPRIARRILPVQTAAGAAGTDLSRIQAKLDTEVRALHRTVAKLDARVTDVQSTVSDNARTVAEIAKKIETAAAPITAATQPQTSPITLGSVRSVATTTERPQPPAQAGRRNSKLPPLPTRVVRRQIRRPPTRQTTVATGSPAVPNIINRNQPATDVTTGSLPPQQPQPSTPEPAKHTNPAPVAAPQPVTPPQQQNARVQFGAPIVRPPVAPAAVTLARALSLNELQATWEKLVSSHPALLGGLQPRYSQDRSGAYILLAGPLDDHTHAGRLCQALRSSGVGCGINTYTGNAL